jgi:hypothetical protein
VGRAAHPDLGEIRLHLVGTRGALVVAEARPEVAIHRRETAPRSFPHVRVAGDLDYLLMENLARAIERNEPTLLDARLGRRICATVTAALESARLGQPVTVH